MDRTSFPRSTRRLRLLVALGVLTALALILSAGPAGAATVSRKYKLERNKPLTLDLSASGVRAEKVTFEFPSSVLRFQTANKARVVVANEGSSRVRVGLAIALFDSEGNLVGAGTGGNKGGKVGPTESEEFSVFFYYVSEQIESAAIFQISMEVN